MVKRKGGPTRTRLTAPTKPRSSSDRLTKRPPVRVECRMERCSFKATGRSWRVARRVRDEHQASKHKAKVTANQ
jgi:hypothetical protein